MSCKLKECAIGNVCETHDCIIGVSQKQCPYEVIEKLRAILKPHYSDKRIEEVLQEDVCLAYQVSDQMICGACMLVWDMNDCEPPACKRKKL